jgi:diphthamide biosynthesis protein 7
MALPTATSQALLRAELTTAASLFQVDTVYSADCIEWCPFDGFQDIFICGTYQVLEPKLPEKEGDASQARGNGSDAEEDEDELSDAPKKQTQRTGRLLVFEVDGETGSAWVFDNPRLSTLTLRREIQRIDTPAILDAKW